MSSAIDDKFLYRYDPRKPWAHRNNEAPSISSVERGKRNRVSKMKKVYLVKKRKSKMRTNAPYRNLQVTTLYCCRKACLSGTTKALIQFQRQRIYNQDYQSLNYAIASNIKIDTLLNGRSNIVYAVPGLGTVCKTGFKKVFAISDKKILVLLKKQNIGDPTLQRDQRGKHKRNARKLLPSVVQLVINFIKDYNPGPSHYRRKTTSKLYFDSKYTLSDMWKKFIKQYPDLKSNGLKTKNKGAPLSYSAFRKVFIDKMSHQYSFKKARVDTCQTCDMYARKIKDLNTQDELLNLKCKLDGHLKESEIRYGAIAYDMNVLAAPK